MQNKIGENYKERFRKTRITFNFNFTKQYHVTFVVDFI